MTTATPTTKTQRARADGHAPHFDVAVIGGGSGLTAAYYAVQDGKSVALIDAQPEALGGTCVYRGCQPTKTMTHAADVYETIKHAAHAGIDIDLEHVRPNFAAIMRQVRERREDNSSSVRDWVEEKMTPFFGRVRFVGGNTLEMDDGRRLSADRVFIATGARPTLPKIPGIEDVEALTNESVLELEEMPKRLLILGAGYIGCEFGYFFSAIDADVTVVDHSGALPREDGDIRSMFEDSFGKRVDLILGCEVSKFERAPSGAVRATINHCQGEHDDFPQTIEVDAVLLATGRKPNTDSLDLQAAGIETDDNGFIVVDEHLETTAPGVFAYGDCIGQAMFKHTSSYEGELAYRNAMGAERDVDYGANPHAVYTKPQVASVGMTEEECIERKLDYEATSVPFAQFAKGEILGEPEGLAKLIVERETERILGFHLAGPSAAVMIHEVVVAMQCEGESAKRVRDAIHVHPSASELISKAFSKV